MLMPVSRSCCAWSARWSAVTRCPSTSSTWTAWSGGSNCKSTRTRGWSLQKWTDGRRYAAAIKTMKEDKIIIAYIPRARWKQTHLDVLDGWVDIELHWAAVGIWRSQTALKKLFHTSVRMLVETFYLLSPRLTTSCLAVPPTRHIQPSHPGRLYFRKNQMYMMSTSCCCRFWKARLVFLLSCFT